MARGVNKILNDQEILLSVGPFLGLDTQTAPMFVAPNNCVAQQNVSLNQQYGAFSITPGRVANITSTPFPDTILTLGVTQFLENGAATPYYPGIYAITGSNPTGASAYYAGYNQAPIPINNWVVTTPLVPNSGYLTDGKFLFVGPYVIPDIPLLQPQIIKGSAVYLSTNAVNWGIVGPSTAPTAAVGAAGNLTGSYAWAVTFVNNTGAFNQIESSPSIFSPTALLVLTSQQANLTGIPVSTDTQVNQRNIYRIGGSIGGTPLLVGSITDNTTTTYTDNLADSQVTGQQLILRQDPAPAGGWTAIAFHKGRVWGFGSTYQANQNKSDLWYSNYLLFTSFNSVTQVLDCDTTVDDLPMALASLDSVLVCLKQKSLWLCYGDTQNDFITRRVFGVGCISKGSVAVGYGKVFWLSSEGVYMWDGNTVPVNISDGNIPSGSIRNIVNTLYNAPSQGGNIDVGVRGWIVNRTYYMSIYSLSGTFPTATYAYDLTVNAWSRLPYSTFAVGVCQSSIYNPVANGSRGVMGAPIVLAASTANQGQVDQWFSATSDLGNPITATWLTNVSDSNMPGITKFYKYIEIAAPNQVATIQVTLYCNPGFNQQVFGPYTVDLSTGSNRSRISLPSGALGYDCQMLISTTSSVNVTIYKAAVLGFVKRAESPEPASN